MDYWEVTEMAGQVMHTVDLNSNSQNLEANQKAGKRLGKCITYVSFGGHNIIRAPSCSRSSRWTSSKGCQELRRGLVLRFSPLSKLLYSTSR